jgi:hypothetical protein
MALIALLLLVVWAMLLRHFRNSAAMQKFIAETFGDDTPERALRTFEIAKRRLADHLNDRDLDDQTRERIEAALAASSQDQAIACCADDAAD